MRLKKYSTGFKHICSQCTKFRTIWCPHKEQNPEARACEFLQIKDTVDIEIKEFLPGVHQEIPIRRLIELMPHPTLKNIGLKTITEE